MENMLFKKMKWIFIFFVCCFLYYSCSSNNVSQFNGTFIVDYASNPNWHYTVNISNDGRCVGGLDGDKFIGYVRPISDGAFMLSEAKYDTWDLHIYKNGKVIGSREAGLYNIVFDIENRRIYFNENDYLNRDISNPEYSIIR
jgi:hypothetical protein